MIMGLYAQKLGIPKEHIFYDTLAKHSTENIYYSYLIAKKKGFKKVGMATDGLQSIFLKKFLRKHFSSPIYILPIIKDSVDSYTALNITIDPAPAKKENFVSIDEGQNIFKRILKPGKSIDWSKHKDGKLPAL
jgi:hypothetical protein